LEILKSKGDEYKYNKISLNYQKFDVKEANYQMNESFNINGNSHQIINYEILDRTEYQYEECVNEVCNNYIKPVSPRTGDAVLVLEITDLDKLSEDFLSSAIGLQYNNKTVYGNNLKYLDRHDNKVYLSVNAVVRNVDNLKAIITTRSNKNIITLGGGNNE
jgi:hypothetical protein